MHMAHPGFNWKAPASPRTMVYRSSWFGWAVVGSCRPRPEESLSQRLRGEAGGVVLRGHVLGDQARGIGVRLRPDRRRLAVGSVAELAGTSHEGGKVLRRGGELWVGGHRRAPFLLAEGMGAAGAGHNQVNCERRRPPSHFARLSPHPLSRQTMLCEGRTDPTESVVTLLGQSVNHSHGVYYFKPAQKLHQFLSFTPTARRYSRLIIIAFPRERQIQAQHPYAAGLGVSHRSDPAAHARWGCGE